jgi:uncharacterized membrane protein YgcG
MGSSAKKRSLGFKVTFVLTAIVGLALLVAAFVVPQGPGGVIDLYDRGLKGGPDSYFHHIYDPNHLLGPLGNVDFDLDNFQTHTGNVIIFAAFDTMPSEDPLFTLYTAERWAPGAKGDDRGLVVFVFMKERQIRAEIGYGLEEELTDVAMSHILDATMVPLLRAGKPIEAVKTCTRELQNRLAQIRGPIAQRTFLEELPVHLREFKRKAPFVVRIWIQVALAPRLILSAIALLLWGGLVSMVVNLGQALIKLIKFGQRAWLRHDMEGGLRALTGMVDAVMGIVTPAVFVLLAVAGGGYFLGGSGTFGGGGVNVFW